MLTGDSLGTARTKLRYRVGVAFAVVLVGVLLIVVGNHVNRNYHPVVVGELYRSAQPTPAMLRRIQQSDNIRTVINLRGPWADATWYEQEHAAARALGIEIYDVSLQSHNLAPLRELRKLIAALDECPKPVLLHCRQGADRTSLAVALYMVLYHNASLDGAMDHYRIWYGHTGWARGHHLPHLFDCYQEWLDDCARPHSAQAFRDWVQSESVIGYFGATIVADEPVMQRRAGEPIDCRFTVRNISRQLWRTTSPFEDGIHLVLTVQTPAGSKLSLRAGPKPGAVAPGETMVIPVRLPACNRPGKYDIRADIRDGYDFRFAEMGKGVCWVTLNVADSNHAYSTELPTGEDVQQPAPRSAGKKSRELLGARDRSTRFDR